MTTPMPTHHLASRHRLLTTTCCAVAGLLLCAVSAGFWLELLPDPPTPAQDLALGALLLVDLATGVTALILLGGQERRPAGWAAALIGGATAVSLLAVPAALVVVARVAAAGAWRRLVLMVLVMVIAAVANDRLWSSALGMPSEHWFALVGIAVMLLGIPVLVGVARGRRAAEVAALGEAAAAAQREHAALLRVHQAEVGEAEARLAQAREAERTRIAREMHDSLAHHLSLIAVHAGVLEHRADLDRDQTRSAAETVAVAARSANAELRQVLGVLRSGQTEAAPIPDLHQLDELLTADVEVESDTVDLAAVPRATSRHAYRILQEALTNARKHAPSRPVRVRLTGAPGDGLTVSVRNPTVTTRAGEHGPPGTAALGTAALGAGLGLVGLSERARLSGGWCRTSGSDPGTATPEEFVVEAWLPW